MLHLNKFKFNRIYYSLSTSLFRILHEYIVNRIFKYRKMSRIIILVLLHFDQLYYCTVQELLFSNFFWFSFQMWRIIMFSILLHILSVECQPMDSVEDLRWPNSLASPSSRELLLKHHAQIMKQRNPSYNVYRSGKPKQCFVVNWKVWIDIFKFFFIMSKKNPQPSKVAG